MGIADRDYMRDRYRDRARREASDMAPRPSKTYSYESTDHKKMLSWTAGFILLALLLAWASVQSKSAITADEFNRLEVGMTLEQAISIIGGPPESSIVLDGTGFFDSTTYIWSGKVPDSGAMIDFNKSGRLSHKISIGLPVHSSVAQPASSLKTSLNARRAETSSRRQYPVAQIVEKPVDRPFPASGSLHRSLPLTGNIARVRINNRSRQNMAAVWYYNVGYGDQEAARLYVRSGQSAMLDLPTYDYRLGIISAPVSAGFYEGFGSGAEISDQGFIDLKLPAIALSRLPSYTFYDTN